ncbi:MAG: multifunctional CCA addition/repair protein [Pseudomonadota bacterium]
MKTYLVGGAVRDKLLGLPVTEKDWMVVGASPDEMLALGYKPVGKDFPVFLHPETKEEYALARTERKSGKGYTGFQFYTSPEVTLEDDLQRRDLTINAIAEDASGELIDPHNGKEDIKRGYLRHVSAAFIEDPLRVMRVARFASRFGFKVAPETMQLMKQISDSDELQELTAERVWIETEKALQGKYPARFILVLRACNALKVIFPELEKLFGIPQPEQHHPEIDSGLHTIMVLNQATRLSDNTVVRFAALMHDLGKGTTPESNWPSHHGHEGRGVMIINNLCDRLKIPNKYRELACLVSKYHLDCHRIRDMKADTILKKLEQLDAFRRPERFEDFLLACEADARGRAGMEEDEYQQASIFKQCLAVANEVNADSIDKELKGKALGEAINKARIDNIKKVINAI